MPPDQAADALELDRKALLALLDASSAVADQMDLKLVFEQVTRQAAAVLNAEAASLLVLESGGEELVFETALGPASDALRGRRMPRDEGIAGQVLRTGRAVAIDDVRANSNFFRKIDEETSMRTRSLAAAPLFHQGEALGVVEVLNPRGRDAFDDGDIKLLQIFANLVSAAMHSAQRLDQCSKRNEALRRSAPARSVIGSSESFAAALTLCRKVAGANTTVLITGETGSGKEVAARHIHDESPRAGRPFVAVNCAAITETLLESELFGHEKGAFTGAEKTRQGMFELADGGTLFLDEIGECNGSTQAKLLRVLQEREFTRVGGTETITCDVRVLAATNRDLREEVARGAFREDLLFRLNVFPVHMPPLRERRSDIPELVAHFVAELAPQLGRAAPRVSDDAIAVMQRFNWPGNIRELRNVVERCLLLADDEILPEHLPPDFGLDDGADADAASVSVAAATSGGEVGAIRLQGGTLANHERTIIEQTLAANDWNVSESSRKLGVTRDFLRYRIAKYGLARPD